jgi:PII-like signaling protein
VSDLTQMRFHFGERDRDGDGPLEAAVMSACARHGVRAAALMRGSEGFGGKHRLRTDRLLSLSEDTPLVAVAVGEAAEVEALAAEVREMAGEGLIVLETTTTGPATPSAAVVAGPVVGGPGDGGGAADRDRRERSGDGRAGDEEGSAPVKATIWGPRTGPNSPHLEAVAALKRHGAESATVLLGVDGVLEGERRRARFVAGNRAVPALTVGVGKRSAIEAAISEIDTTTHLVTVEPVELYRRIATLSLHTEPPVELSSRIARATLHTDPSDPSVAPKSRIARQRRHGADAIRVVLVTSEVASRGSHPVYVEFIHRLRREGAAGATAQRGVWGFRGDEEPHGDRVLALRRDVPMVVEVVDAAERAGRWLEIAEEVACEGDVVYSQAVGRSLTLE